MTTPQLTTVSEFIDDMFSQNDVHTKEITINDTIMLRYTVNFNDHTVSTIINNNEFHSIIVKRKNNDTYDSYVFYDKNAKIEDLYKNYEDILDIKNYTEGHLCIHEQSDKYQNDYLNDIIERVYILYRNETFPDTVPVFFDLDDDTYNSILEMANERGIEPQELMTKIVVNMFETLKKESN